MSGYILVIRPPKEGRKTMAIVPAAKDTFNQAARLLNGAMLESVYTQPLVLARQFVVLADEEGLMRNAPPCLMTPDNVMIVGTVVLVAANRRGDFIGMTMVDLNRVQLIASVRSPIPTLHILPLPKET